MVSSALSIRNDGITHGNKAGKMQLYEGMDGIISPMTKHICLCNFHRYLSNPLLRGGGRNHFLLLSKIA